MGCRQHFHTSFSTYPEFIWVWHYLHFFYREGCLTPLRVRLQLALIYKSSSVKKQKLPAPCKNPVLENRTRMACRQTARIMPAACPHRLPVSLFKVREKMTLSSKTPSVSLMLWKNKDPDRSASIERIFQKKAVFSGSSIG